MNLQLHRDWDTLAALPDDVLPLLSVTLLIACDEYPRLDAPAYESEFHRLSLMLARRIEESSTLPQRVRALNRFLFEELGFSGNQDDFYDPRNSYLNEVVDRRLGIPISLAVVQLELAQRLHIPLEGVSFPGHFLVRLPVEEGVVVMDPFQGGRSIDVDELRQRARPHFGDRDIDDRQLTQILSPASPRTIAMRMLRNLKGVYTEQEDWGRALRCSDRLLRLDPTQVDELRDRGLGYLRTGHGAAAERDLSRYLSLAPQASDAEEIREQMVGAAGLRVRLH